MAGAELAWAQLAVDLAVGAETNGEMPLIAGRDIDMALLEDGIPIGKQDARRALLVEALGHCSGKAAIDVLDDDRRRAIFRETAQHMMQRFHAAGRGADGDDRIFDALAAQAPVAAARRARWRAARAGRTRKMAREARRINSASLPSSLTISPPPLGLPQQSTAPSSSARTVAVAPSCVSVETMMTGVGRRRMIFSRKSRPFMPGHLDVERHHVGVERLDLPCVLPGVGRLAHNLQIRLAIDHDPQQRTHGCACRRQ